MATVMIEDARTEEKRLLNVTEAATYLDCSIPTLRALIWNGAIPEIRITRRVQVDRKDLDTFIEKMKRSALTENGAGLRESLK
jgi:excisionase family DNA binding protein